MYVDYTIYEPSNNIGKYVYITSVSLFIGNDKYKKLVFFDEHSSFVRTYKHLVLPIQIIYTSYVCTYVLLVTYVCTALIVYFIKFLST